jgi:soluble lytic murein transglycosylase-like protein
VIPGIRLWLLFAALVSLLLATRSPADEGIARRLAALKLLTNPAQAQSVVPELPATAGTTCGSGRAAWWRMTEYGVRARIDTAVRDASLRFRVDPRLVHSVIRFESNYAVAAVSHKGAMGLMQLMPRTAARLGVICAFDPRENILGGTRYLRHLYDDLGSWPRAVAAYNAGPARVESGRIPAETRRYVDQVIGRWRPEQLKRSPLD